jgi:ATP phosphoribosyltransferase regulatory subunit HisZ
MAEIINLRQQRKAQARRAAEKVAAENRARHGRTKAYRQQDRLEGELSHRRLDGHKIERDEP